MYSYTYDSQTGGILLHFSPTGFSKEPRPVYAAELDILGFDAYWIYDKQMELPYMWAEANSYWYRGKRVARLKGGNIYTAPEILISEDENGVPVYPEPDGAPLRPIDIPSMVEANQEILEIVEQSTVKKILGVYEKYKKKVDLFHVAFSGGKDSIVLLDLVKKALPKGSFVVVFGDTGMEFPDTYDVVEKTRRSCEKEEIPFYVAKSHLDPKDSWEMFGPPSRVLRWCCSVHKSVPQTLKLREITGKNNYTGLAFVGVRAHESTARAKYEYENYGKKQKGQYSHNSILEWTSAEVWIYVYTNKLLMNEAYKKGNARVGCILCPMSIKKADFIKFKAYSREISLFLDLIKKTSGRNFSVDSFIAEGGWVSRRSGRDLLNNETKYFETIKNGVLTIKVLKSKSDWREWIKTLDAFNPIPYTVRKSNNGYVVQLAESFIKKNPTLGRLFKQVFRKAAYCVSCGLCEANCASGCLKFDEKITITSCEHCLKCHDIENGCLAYQSLRMPREEKTMSINCFDSVLPKNNWFARFFKEKDAFWEDHGLGPNQVKTFKRFLRDSGLTEKNSYSKLAELVGGLGWETSTAWGILCVNLAEDNPQIRWYITHFELGCQYARNTVISMILEYSNSKNIAKFVYGAFGKLVELPLGTVLHFGHVTEDGDLVRTRCSVPDSRVLLYGLFKFAEKCNDYKKFTLSTLLNDSIDRDGISPARIFGLDREDMTPLLLGLSAKYPDFINASFTHDLEKITLAENKTSADVLDLFREGMTNGE